MRAPRSAVIAVSLAIAPCLAACGGSDSTDSARQAAGSSTSQGSTDALTGVVVVFAAASLTETFSELGEKFERANPDVTVTFNFGSSSTLAAQIISGAPADVFAAASSQTMATVTEAGFAAGEPAIFVSNRLEIAVPAGNPGGVTGLADFANPDLTIGLCAEEVPCGAAAAEVFEAAGIIPAPDTLERDVKAVLTKVELGEVDAALVYRTDVLAAGDAVEGIEFPEAQQAINNYRIAVVVGAPNPPVAQAFRAFVRSADGLQVLADAGFETD